MNARRAAVAVTLVAAGLLAWLVATSSMLQPGRLQEVLALFSLC